MREMSERLASRPRRWRPRTPRAHEAYLGARASRSASVPEIAGVSAGGMPDRVKCLHVLAGQSLAQGRGVNPLGDEVLDRLGAWWASGPCVPTARRRARHDPRRRHRLRHQHDQAARSPTSTRTGRMVEHVREMRMVRLGQGVDRTGRLAEAALERVFAARRRVRRDRSRARRRATRFCATSAARDAENADVFTAGVEERLGRRAGGARRRRGGRGCPSPGRPGCCAAGLRRAGTS